MREQAKALWKHYAASYLKDGSDCIAGWLVQQSRKVNKGKKTFLGEI